MTTSERRPLGLGAALLTGALLFLLHPFAQAEIYTVYNDKTTVGDNVYAGGIGAAFDGSSHAVPAAEGIKSFLTNTTATGWWGLFFNPGNPLDLSRFAGGHVRFWMRSNTGAILIHLEYMNGDRQNWDLSPYWTSDMADTWVPWELDLGAASLAGIKSPFIIETTGPGAFYIDDVHYVDTSAYPIFNVELRNRSNDAVASKITFSDPALPASWVVADQYLRMELDPDDLSWGVQIYTDNTDPAADPRFTTQATPGEPGSNPAGLVDVSSASKTLPMAWSVKGATITTPSAANPNDHSDPNSFQWLYLLDRATPAIPSENTEAFADGNPFPTVKTNVGIHYGQNALEFGGDDATNRIYLQADFSRAVTPRTYRTNALRVEYFTQ